jgi:glycosyltransferase involved in cell wall biosynthesis
VKDSPNSYVSFGGQRKLVAILSYLDYPFPAGLARRIDGFVDSLGNAGFVPRVICPAFRSANPSEAPHVTRFDLRFLRALGAERLLTKIIALIAFNLIAFARVIAVRKELLTIQSESIYSLPAAFLAKIFLGSPCIVDDVLLPANSRFASFMSFMVGAFSDLALSSTKSTQLDRFVKRVLYVPTGVAAVFSNERLLNFDRLNVLFVGALSYDANLVAAKHVIRAASLLPRDCKCKFLIVGGPIPADVCSNLRVSLLGSLDDESLRRVYCDSNIGVLPFFGVSAEGPKVKVLEYMAAGLLVVSSPEGVEGYPGLIPGEHYVRVESTNQLVKALDEIPRLQGPHAEIARRAHEYVMSHYRWPDLLRAYLAFLEDLALDIQTRHDLTCES